jgi:hypothetical protein
LQNATISFVMSVRPSARNIRLPPNRLSLILTFENFSKICRKNVSVVKIWQE